MIKMIKYNQFRKSHNLKMKIKVFNKKVNIINQVKIK